MSKLREEEILACRGCVCFKKYPKNCGFCSTWLKREVHRLENIIQNRPEFTEEFILGKATEAYNLLYYKTFSPDDVTDFIRSLVEEIRGK